MPVLFLRILDDLEPVGIDDETLGAARTGVHLRSGQLPAEEGGPLRLRVADVDCELGETGEDRSGQGETHVSPADESDTGQCFR